MDGALRRSQLLSTRPTPISRSIRLLLSDEPELAATLEASGYVYRQNPGLWWSPEGVGIDLLVPEAVAGQGTRSADVRPHDRRTARRARGLEAALVDRTSRSITSLEPERDPREREMLVAGPTALLVAKIIKISERSAEPTRIVDKDALDVLRLLQSCETEQFVEKLNSLRRDERTEELVASAVGELGRLALGADAPMATMVDRQVRPFGDSAIAIASLQTLVEDLIGEWSGLGSLTETVRGEKVLGTLHTVIGLRQRPGWRGCFGGQNTPRTRNPLGRRT